MKIYEIFFRFICIELFWRNEGKMLKKSEKKRYQKPKMKVYPFKAQAKLMKISSPDVLDVVDEDP